MEDRLICKRKASRKLCLAPKPRHQVPNPKQKRSPSGKVNFRREEALKRGREETTATGGIAPAPGTISSTLVAAHTTLVLASRTFLLASKSSVLASRTPVLAGKSSVPNA